MLNRRQLLETTAVVVLSASFSKEAYSSGHNGKKLQTDVSGDYPFINVFKSASWWIGDAGKAFDPLFVDVNGYPTGLHRNFLISCQCYIPKAASRPGQYVCYTDGVGSYQVSGMPSVVSVSGKNQRHLFTPDAANSNDGTLHFYLRTINSPPNHITNVRICHVDDEAAMLAGQVFQKRYKEYIGNFGVLRFLGGTNVTNVVKWADRTPIDYYSYGVGNFPSQYLAGMATQATGGGPNNLIYTATLKDFSLVDKARVICTFDKATGYKDLSVQSIKFGASTVLNFTAGANTQFSPGMHIFLGALSSIARGQGTFQDILSWSLFRVIAADENTITIDADTSSATGTYKPGSVNACAVPTLSINGGRAVPIGNFVYSPGAIGSSPFSPGYISTLVYDAALNVWIAFSEQYSIIGINAGSPIEYCVQLCNEVGAHPWFCIPFLALDADGHLPTLPDYTKELATYCKNNLASGLIPRFEPSNEVWNDRFPATRFAWVRQWVRNKHIGGMAGELFDYMNWYGQALSEMGQLVSAVYENDKTKYNVICAFQTGVGGAGNNVYRLVSPVYYRLAGNDNSKRAFQWVTHVSCATYWGTGYYDTAYEKTLAMQYVNGDANAKADAVAQYVGSALATGNTWNGQPSPYYFTIPKLVTFYKAFQTIANSYTNNSGNKLGLTAYEGGYSPDYGPDKNLNELRRASKQSPLLVDYTQLNDRNFMAQGSDAKFPSEFSFAGGGTVWPIWDPDTYATPTPPRWTAIVTF